MKLSNGIISIEVSAHGAELLSLTQGDTEYIWQGDPQFWGRHAPILFPIVGKVWNGTYHVAGREYRLPQHGFARDRDFVLLRADEEALAFRLASDEESRKVYPYDFELTAEYRLNRKSVEVCWRVRNSGAQVMHYQIGAHPAFLYRQFDPQAPLHGSLSVANLTGSSVKTAVTGELSDGFRVERAQPMKIRHLLPLEPNTFDHDALMLEDGQAKIVTLHDKQGRPYLRLTSDCQVMGLWSPKGKAAPFVCVEPWMGRCDRQGFEGDISERDFIQVLGPGEEREFRYTVEVMDLPACLA